MSGENKIMDRDKLLSTLQRIRAIVDEALADTGHKREARRKAIPRTAQETPKAVAISFNTNVLAFMTKYARGLKGAQKFTLLLAYTVKGKTSQQETRATLEKQWNKMKGVLGKFNPAHGSRAKAKGWVDSPKHGVYTLSDSWKECLIKK